MSDRNKGSIDLLWLFTCCDILLQVRASDTTSAVRCYCFKFGLVMPPVLSVK